ncbi:MAG: preprotein translocase subunit SecE [Desulfovibrionaceae bacterium]
MGGMGDKARQLKEFFEESKVELKKVTWPSRKETITTGIAVVVLVIVFSLFLGIVDLGLSKVVKLILS